MAPDERKYLQLAAVKVRGFGLCAENISEITKQLVSETQK